MKSFILGPVIIVLTVYCSAQQPASAPSGADPQGRIRGEAGPAPTGQAPDDLTNKITVLVHAGKYVEAQQLTTGLLIAYLNDPRLIKAKALIDRPLSPAGSTNPAPAGNQPTGNVPSAKPAANASAEQLTGMDKVDYNALIELARQAQQTADLDKQKKLLQQFMEQSSAFLQKHPDQMPLWQFRVVSAIGLNEPMKGMKRGRSF
jgi:hypothetical protein